MKAKCDKCLRGTKLTTTGVSPSNVTLRLDIGGAVMFVTPKPDGKIDVSLNTQNLFEGKYAYAVWDSEKWII